MPDYDDDDATASRRGSKVEKFDDEPSHNLVAGAAAPPSYKGGPPQRQHKYSTKDMKPERPWKRWCLTLLGCLICIAIMIALTILMQHLFDPPEGTQSFGDVDIIALVFATLSVVLVLTPNVCRVCNLISSFYLFFDSNPTTINRRRLG
jgi:hypothetical protein